MYQLVILVGIILLYLIFRVLKRASFSMEVIRSKTHVKTPEDVLAMFYKETHDYPFLQEKPLFLLSSELDSITDADEFGTRIAEEILNYLRIPFSSIRFQYSDKNEAPRVVMNSIHGFDFQLPSDLKQSKGAIKALVVYECARIYLASLGNDFACEVKDKHLTDYAVIFLGLGVPFLKDLDDLKDILRHIEPEFSYFTNPDDLMMIMAVYLGQHDLTPDILQPHLDAFQIRKIHRIYRDYDKRPFQILHRDAFDIILRCHRCFQVLRIPSDKKLMVTCSTCNHRFEFKP